MSDDPLAAMAAEHEVDQVREAMMAKARAQADALSGRATDEANSEAEAAAEPEPEAAPVKKVKQPQRASFTVAAGDEGPVVMLKAAMRGDQDVQVRRDHGALLLLLRRLLRRRRRLLLLLLLVVLVLLMVVVLLVLLLLLLLLRPVLLLQPLADCHPRSWL